MKINLIINTKALIQKLVILTLYLVCLNTAYLKATPYNHRIISTDASATNLLFHLGMQDQLIAVDVTSRLPEGFNALPNIGYHRNLSAEGLLSLKPTLVIGSDLMGPSHIVPTLAKANIQVVQLPSAKIASTLKKNIERISAVLGKPEHAQQLIHRMDQKLINLNAHALSNERIAFLLSMDPNKLRLAGKSTNGDAMIKLLGAKNIAKFDNYQTVSAESLLSLSPTVIVVVGTAKNSAVKDLITAQEILKFTPAGRKQNIISIDGGSLVAGLSVASIDEALEVANTVIANQATTNKQSFIANSAQLRPKVK